jgi:glycosyltransferase involved in cell wall biosynthesis/predicted metal-dependent phosphoesterase TrpH
LQRNLHVMTARADLHCHSTASQISKLGVQRALGLPECATPPEEVYALAKRRGMDFVTITDHDTIEGVVAIADRPDVFVSEELTARFAGEPQAVHVLCLGITPDDHERLQERAGDVESVAEYLHGNGITCALAHPFYKVAAPLAPRHRRRLAELFDVWEVRNGARAPELNQPAWIYTETRGGTGVGGSDDHAGVDIGRTWTQTPAAATPEEYLAHIRAGRAIAGGDQGSAAKWAHAAMALAVRTLGAAGRGEPPDPAAVLRMAERVMVEGDARTGAIGADLSPADASALLRAWLDATGLEPDGERLLAWMEDDGFRHADLLRRARRSHERALQGAVDRLLAVARGPEPDWADAALGVFRASISAVPYVPAMAFLARETTQLSAASERPRVAVIADGIGSTHGVTRTLAEIAERGVPGFDVEIVGSDARVDRRVPAVTDVPLPYAPDVTVGVPSLLAMTEALTQGRYDLVHISAPGPAGLLAMLCAHVLELPVAGAHHTELAAYAAERAADPRVALAAQAGLAAFYGRCATVLSPSAAADAGLAALGVGPEKIARWDRGVDLGRFSPLRRVPGRLGDEAHVHVLYAGRLTREKDIALLGEAFALAHERDPRLRLSIAGGGPEQAALAARLGSLVRFHGWLDGDDLATAYASADLFLFCSQTDTFGQVVLEAQASGLPVVAVDAGGPAELIADGRSGLLCPPDAATLAGALAGLAASRAARDRLARGGRAAAAERSWDAALARLAGGWRRALGAAEAGGTDRAPAAAERAA